MPELSAQPGLHEFQTRELLEELTRRSIGLLAAQVSVGEKNQDKWCFAFRGSPYMLMSMSSILNAELVQHITAARE